MMMKMMFRGDMSAPDNFAAVTASVTFTESYDIKVKPEQQSVIKNSRKAVSKLIQTSILERSELWWLNLKSHPKKSHRNFIFIENMQTNIKVESFKEIKEKQMTNVSFRQVGLVVCLPKMVKSNFSPHFPPISFEETSISPSIVFGPFGVVF